MNKESIGVGLMGLGVVSGGVARVLTEKADLLARQVGCPLELKKIKVLGAGKVRFQAKELGLALFTTDDDEFFNQSGMDIIIEAIGGEEPARQYIKRALSTGKHVVTSNKELVAKHGAELFALAQEHGVGLQNSGF